MAIQEIKNLSGQTVVIFDDDPDMQQDRMDQIAESFLRNMQDQPQTQERRTLWESVTEMQMKREKLDQLQRFRFPAQDG